MKKTAQSWRFSCGLLAASIALSVSGCMKQKVSLMTNEPFKMDCKYHIKEDKERGAFEIIVDPTMDYATMKVYELDYYGGKYKNLDTAETIKAINQNRSRIEVLEKTPSTIILGNRTFYKSYSSDLGKNISIRHEYSINRVTGDVSFSLYAVDADSYDDDVWSSIPMKDSKYIKENLIKLPTQSFLPTCNPERL